ncbi:hypothetical protein Pcinc_005046 [Petrolisthes cinctipes]|uniref:Uncharacterized protein n=1 Tax=Petrolisthes cinctipes TaxID=88211 RepID=A0AAE1GFP4_PETCI|nr:hypothetical protein Pcinc_005046 [Petrolisthes cinctipes]
MVLVCEEGKEVGPGVGVNQACMREQEHEQARAVAVACLVGCQGQLGIASQPHRPRKLYLHLSPSFHPFPTPAHLPSSQKKCENWENTHHLTSHPPKGLDKQM